MPVSFRGLLDLVDTASSRTALSDAMRSFALSHGFEHHAYLNLQGPRAAYLGNYPHSWSRVYLEQGFSGLDPVVNRARNCGGVFFWSAADWRRSRASPVARFATAAINHGIAYGMTIAARGSFDSQLMLTFANSKEELRPVPEQHLREAVPVLMALHYRYVQLRQDKPESEKGLLSSRELLCLTWAAKGKVAPETARITGLSARTVQHYLDSARQKLGAATLPQLIAISKDRNLI